MAQASTGKAALMGILRGPSTRGPREAMLIFTSAVALFLLLALSTYHPGDPGWSHTGPSGPVVNEAGVVGAWLADVFLYAFGIMAYVNIDIPREGEEHDGPWPVDEHEWDEHEDDPFAHFIATLVQMWQPPAMELFVQIAIADHIGDAHMRHDRR